MLGRLVLLLLQIAVGWFGSQAIMKYIQMGGILRLFIFAVVAAIVVFLVGVIAAQVLREVAQPSSHTLLWAVVLALVAAAIWTWGPQFVPQLRQIQAEYAVLAGAILGYMIKR
jgi:predicted acyltransferase